MEEEDEDGGEGCFAGGKIFLTAFASPPTSDFSHSSLLVLFYPFGGRSPPMLALFLTLFHSEKLSLRSRALPPLYVCACLRASRGFIHVCHAYVCMRVYIYVCVRVRLCVYVNDARTMALNWRLTGEQ